MKEEPFYRLSDVTKQDLQDLVLREGPVVLDGLCCPCCDRHHDLTFAPFEEPLQSSYTWTHYARCDEAGLTVLLSVVRRQFRDSQFVVDLAYTSAAPRGQDGQ